MRPGGRIQAVIDLLERIEAPAAGKEDVPADVAVSAYFRGRRYIGGGDRRFIGDLVFDILRNRARLVWRAGAELDPRRQAVTAARLLREWERPEIAAAFDGSTYAPAPLTPEEHALLDRIEAPPDGPEPLAIRGNLPDWLADRFAVALGDAAAPELSALARPAPVDLRVNTLKAGLDEARAALTAEGVAAAPTRWSPRCLRVAERTPLTQTAAFRDGWIEVQDEGSQIAAALVDPRPGMAVLDLCAGAGGKTLAIAAAMANAGTILATDVDSARLRSLETRAARAGVAIIDTRAGDAVEQVIEGVFDRVLVDVPCSGSGAWRRHPEAPWRLTPARLAAYIDRQAALLRRAAELTAPGGRLIYITCSLLPCENEARIETFLAERSDYRTLPVASIWRRVLNGECPADGDRLVASPYRTDTDGFFVAILERLP